MPAGAVDEVEEDDLAHVPAAHDPAGQAARRLRLGARLERLGLGADGRDLDAVGETLGQPGHDASLVPDRCQALSILGAETPGLELA